MDRSSRADVEHLRTSAKRMRRWIIEQSEASHVGHIGSALSIAEIMVVLWEAVMDRPGASDLDRDRFILCKGHASLALYSALRMRGLLSEEEYATYCGDGSLLGVHPEHFLPGVDVSTGSLGQGLSIGCGLALGLKKKRLASRVFALVSDAECNEGQVWEAVMFAAHHRLENLIATIDLNGLQAMGYTKDIVELSDLVGRFSSFGWDAVEVDGHDVESLLEAYERPGDGRPRAVVAKTVLGKGVSFMEDQVAWHYRNIDAALAKKALEEIGE
jgi:transketolase